MVDVDAGQGGAFHDDPVGFALKKYNYYMCYKCEKPYFGGERDCGAGAGANADDYDPSELVCAVRQWAGFHLLVLLHAYRPTN